MWPSPRYRSRRAVLTSTALCGALLATAGTAAAADRIGPVPTAGDREVLVDGLVGPLSLHVGKHRTVHVSQDFASEIGSVRDGSYTTLVSGAQEQVEHAGVSSVGGTVLFVTSDFPEEGSTDPVDARLWQRDARGHVQELADLGRHEVLRNPDGDVSYGFTNLPAGCELPEGYPFDYTGVVESHPYATEPWHGSVFVADAAGNDILRVDRRGDVHTVAVLPPVPLQVTAELAAEAGFPECVAGSTYLLEPVPTDVEVGRDGWLYVTSLPGGPESPGGPALGSVLRVHPDTGEIQRVATGFVSATNLAIGTKGEIYVTELFANRVSVVPRGSSTPQPFLTDVVLPAAVEVDRRSLYLTTNALPGPDGPPNGTVLRVELDY